MGKLTRNANFSIFHDLRSDLKVLEMGYEVKNIIRGQSKVYLRVFNVKPGKFLPGGAQEQICRAIFGMMPPIWTPSGQF